MEKQRDFFQFYLRIAIGVAYVVFALDRLGAWGPHGAKNVSWGDWEHFVAYARQVMGFFPEPLADISAMIATASEISIGLLLIVGKWTKFAALGSGVLALLFALSMTISFGIISPLSYSVYTLSAASFLLATIGKYKWSVDDGM